MKKFLFTVSQQKAGTLMPQVYQPVGNSALAYPEGTRFPIIPAVNAYAAEGEPFRVIAVTTDSGDERANLALFREELAALCARRGLPCPEVETVAAPTDNSMRAQMGTFRALIALLEGGDGLCGCVTYGTKPMAMILLLALRYGCRVRRDAVLDCLVYGQIDRSGGTGPADWQAYLYDETALVQMDEIVRRLADSGTARPDEIIDHLLQP